MPDEFGGIQVSEDEFGGVLVDEESPSPSVIRDVPRGTLEPTDLFPGIRKMGGEIVPGQIGETHQDIIKREGIKAEDLDQRVFVTPWGDVIDREGAANAVFPKVIPKFEPGRLHSTDLNLPQFESPISIGEEGPVFQSELDIEKKWLGLDQPPKEVSSLEPVSPPSSIPGFMVPEVSPEEKYGAIRQAPKKDIRKMVETGEGLPMMDEESRKMDWLKSQFNQQDKTDEEFLAEHPNLKFAMYGFMSPTDIPMGRISENDAKNLGFGPMSGVVSGAQNSVADFVDFMTSAPGVMTALTGGVAGGAIGAGQAGVGSAIHRGVAYAFAADMARQAPDQFASIIDAIERGDSQAATRGILNASLSLAVMKHGAQLGVTPEGIVPKGLFEKPQVQGPKTTAEMEFGLRPGAQGLATGGTLRVGKERGVPTGIGISEEAPPAERPGEAPLAAPTEGKAEVGEVVQAAPTEPAITTDKTVLPEKQVELSKGEVPADTTDPKVIAQALGVRHDGGGPITGSNMFTMYDPEGKPGTTFVTRPGDTLYDAYKSYVDMRERWKEDPRQPVPPKWEPSAEADKAMESHTAAREVAKETGFTLSPEKQVGGVKITGLPPEIVQKLTESGQKPTFEFTDQRTDSPTRGITFYVQEGATKQQILDAHKAVLDKFEKAKTPDMGLPTTVAAPKPITKKTPQVIAAEDATQSAFEKLGAAEKGAYDKSKRKGMTKPQLKKLAAFDKLVEAEKKAKAEAKMGIAEPITLEMELGAGVSLKGVSDAVKASVEYLKSLRNEELKAPKMNDRRRSILNWSAKLQRSYGEAFSKQRDIIKSVPNKTRREGITNWIQANGDRTVLQDRYNATTDPKLKAGYKAALELTPAEIAVANSVKADYANFAARGQAAGVLGDLKDNYVTQTWNLKKGPGGTGTGRTLKEKFRFSKARTFESFFEGEQLGYTPKTKDIAKLLPMYSHEMNSVIAAREMVAEMGNGVASDGRPLLAPKGVGIPVDAAEGGKATLVIPRAGKADTSDYKVIPNQPALSGWKWVAKDDAGNPVFLKADLAVHPEAVAYLKNVLGRSAIRDWYGTRTTALSELPKIIVKGIDMANSETKRTMLGMLATFHQIQTGTHAIGHRVNPFFSIPKIDLVNNKVQMDAAGHGLMMLPDRASMDQFMEGFRTSGIISKIPGIGPIADYYSHYLFHEYIPGLKFKTYEAILSRNQKVYAKDLAAGRVTPSDIKILSAEQANAAYGHLNYADLGRNPTVQHIAQVGLLAPDFLEARGRFAGQAIKGIAGAKVGREQLLALATLAIAQTATAYVVSRIVDGEWDKKRPFEFVKGNRRYTVRSVPEDIVNLVTKTRQFIHSRLSPLVGKGLLQYLTGVDYRGQKVKASQTTKELAAQPLPLTIRGFTGLGNNTLSGMEQLAGSLGLRISRYSPSLDVYDMVKEFKKSSDDPKLQADIELQEKEVFSSVYDKLRTALRAGDLDAARKEYDAIKSIRTPKQIDNAMKPWTGGNLDVRTFQISPRKPKPFTGSAKTEKLFLQGLNPEQRTMYDKAVKERLEFYNTFKQMLALPGSKETDEFGGIPVE